ncbi:MAG: DUF2269 family protein [Gemmatimonadetes bacterium]|nr:DUF2269 family protein [Gemmatimonadota bacterium]
MNTYLVLKAIHVASAVLMVGNVTVTGAWAFLMYRHWRTTGASFRPVARAILWTDLLFTLAGGAGLTISGVLLARHLALPILGSPWLVRGIAALAVSTLAWLVVLLPDQWRLERATDPAEVRRLFRRWNLVGWTSTAVLYYAIWCMVRKD